MYRPAFATSPLQFGFKPGLSTELCTGLIKNVTARYCFNDSSVFGCFLDASKAFDRVDHHLFDKLLQHNLPPVVVRALLAWYLQQKVSVLSILFQSFCLSLYGSALWNHGMFPHLSYNIWKWHATIF